LGAMMLPVGPVPALKETQLELPRAECHTLPGLMLKVEVDPLFTAELSGSYAVDELPTPGLEAEVP